VLAGDRFLESEVLTTSPEATMPEDASSLRRRYPHRSWPRSLSRGLYAGWLITSCRLARKDVQAFGSRAMCLGCCAVRELRRKAAARTGGLPELCHPGASLDGFWIHRVCSPKDREPLVDAASILTSRPASAGEDRLIRWRPWCAP